MMFSFQNSKQPPKRRRKCALTASNRISGGEALRSSETLATSQKSCRQSRSDCEVWPVPFLISLLRCSDSWMQEHAVTALLNLSLHEDNKMSITNVGAVKSLIYVLKTGIGTLKQNAACALLSLALVEENKGSIGAFDAIPPLVSFLLNGLSRGEKDALTTLYKLCFVRHNKEKAVSVDAVKPLVELVAEQGNDMAEKAMVVLNSLVGI
ncbi:U-box domain-containing protein 13 [Glycine soja]